MEIWIDVAFVIGSYLIGSIPIVHFLARRKGVDLRRVGSGSIGGANLWQSVGMREGIFGGLGDALKGVIPPLAAKWLELPLIMVGLSGLAAMAGQSWPIFARFNGGRANATALGAALVLSPFSFLIAIIPMLIGAAMRMLPILSDRALPLRQRLQFRGPLTNSVPLGMLFGFVLLPVVAYIHQEPAPIVLACVLIPILVLIRRLTAGLRQGMKQGIPVWDLLVNRFLYDRSHR